MKTPYDNIPHVTFEDGSRIYLPEQKLEVITGSRFFWTVSQVMKEFKLYHKGALQLIKYAQQEGKLSESQDNYGRFKVL